MLQHDPLLVFGLFLLGTSAVFSFRIYSAVERNGRAPNLLTRSAAFDLPFDYLKLRIQKHWSPWPVYLYWLCLLGGVFALIAGLLRLNN